jgi:hypothetical protein
MKLIAAALLLVACKAKPVAYQLLGAANDTVAPTTAVVNGREITKTNALGYFVLPPGLTPTTVVFRYQTPCGAFDVPNTVKPPAKGSIDVEAHPADDSGYLWGHLVIVDGGGAVVVGKQSLAPARDSDAKPASDGWDKVHLGRLFGTECAVEHVVTVDGKLVAPLGGRAPKGLAVHENDQYTLPIFITTKQACYRMQLRSVEYTNSKTGASSNGKSYDTVLHGPGVFYLPLMPDLFGKKPDTAEKPSGLFEVPCEPDVDGSAAP